jgi:hypothetical protein
VIERVELAFTRGSSLVRAPATRRAGE